MNTATTKSGKVYEHGDNEEWQGLKFEIPEFHSGQSAEELLDWFVTVEEILEFHRVPTELQLPMIAMRFRGTAAAWWTQLKTSRARLDKPRISSWDKLKKKMRNTFLPFNYEQTMFQRLNKLHQGDGQSVNGYYSEFFKILTHIDQEESEKQIVGRFVGGLKQKIQKQLDVLNLLTLAEALHHALTLEAQFHQEDVQETKVLVGLGISSVVLLFFACVMTKVNCCCHRKRSAV